MPETKPCPCKECVPPKRFPGCHGSCLDYAEWNNDHISQNHKEQKAKSNQAIVDGYVILRKTKIKNKKNLDHAKRKW